MTAVTPAQIHQRDTALVRANAIRLARSQLKRDLKAGRADPVEILIEPPEFARAMPVWDLLLALPAIGLHRGRRLLREAKRDEQWPELSMQTRLSSLTPRQRASLASAYTEYEQKRQERRNRDRKPER